MRPFLITSVGRTATKWLAWVMNQSEKWTVEHEPPVIPHKWWTGAVSPKHLYQIAVGRLDLDDFDTLQLGVIIRDPIAQGVSIQNRARVLKAPCEDLYNKHARAYYWTLDNMLAAGAHLIKYEQMTSDPVYLKAVLQLFGINDVEPGWKDITTKKNVIAPRPMTVLGGTMKRMVHKHAVPFWEKWNGEQESLRDQLRG